VTAWERMVDVATHINDVKRQHERIARTHELRTSLDGVDIIGFGELILEVIIMALLACVSHNINNSFVLWICRAAVTPV